MVVVVDGDEDCNDNELHGDDFLASCPFSDFIRIECRTNTSALPRSKAYYK